MLTLDQVKKILRICEDGNLLKAKEIFETEPSLVNVKDEEFFTPLQAAAANDHVQNIRVYF